MSQDLIARSADLKRLRDEGYDITIRSNHIVINEVPYVNSNRDVKLGTLISELTLNGDIAGPPSTHVALWAGDQPCDQHGAVITAIRHGASSQRIDEGLVANFSFSNKPSDGYRDYYAKVTTYVAIVTHPAQAIDPRVSPLTFPVVEDKEDSSPFRYVDTASSRAGIYSITKKLELPKLAIVGLGGTGSYVLDLVAKTPVNEIHIFDGDVFSNHNAFRSPGAASIDDLRAKPRKVDHFCALYSRMRRRIVAHGYHIDATNVDQLREMSFVFICIDEGKGKKVLVEKLEEFGIPFVDVGMGLYEVDGSLAGTVRVTTSTPTQRDHLRKHVGLNEAAGNDEYSRNIQIADLNALNAALAAIKWKKLFGFYKDLDQEHQSTYTINGNDMANEECSGAPTCSHS